MLGGERDERNTHHRQSGLVVMADDQEVIAALSMENHLGRALDRVGGAEPGAGGPRRPDRWSREEIAQNGILEHVRRGVALEDDRAGARCRGPNRPKTNL